MQRQRALGREGLYVSAIGNGAMVLEGFYGNIAGANAIDVIGHAVDAGCAFIDTADAYGSGHNEQLVGRALTDRRDQAFIALAPEAVAKISRLAAPGMAKGQTLL